MRLTRPRMTGATYERIVAEARARGVRVLITPSGPAPDWATLINNGVDYPSPTRFERFMTAVGRQFGTRITHWSIWNEPNHPQFLGPQYRRHKPYSPRLYRRLFWAAHRALARTGNGRDRVLMGETAPRGNSHVVHPLRFLRGALCLNRRYRKARGCKRLPADGYAHHPYTTRSGPFFVSRRRDDVTIGSLGRLTRALDRAGRARAVRRRLPVYLTEFGIQSTPDPHYGVSQTRQAEYRSIGEKIAWTNRRVRAISQYLMRDDPAGPAATVTEGSSPASASPAAARSSPTAASACRWSRAAPAAAYACGATCGPIPVDDRVEIQYRGRRARWRHLKNDRTNRAGYWISTTRYHSGRSYRVRWRSAGGTAYGSRTRVIRRR